MADESVPTGFRAELHRFRESLSHKHRELLDGLIRAAFSQHRADELAETGWTRPMAEDVLRDLGQLLIEMKGKYRTCGGWCSKYHTDPSGDIFCTPTCVGDVVSQCECHLYSYPTPAPGDDRPKMQDWDHEWSPHDGGHFTPKAGRTYECVCVRKV